MFRFIILLLLFLGLTACTPGTGKPGVSAAEHRQLAGERLKVRDLKGAIKEMGPALAGNPNIEDALLYADLLESQQEYRKARNIYRKAENYPASAAQKRTLAYRLAIVEASDFDNTGTAEKLGEILVPTDSRYFDLQALLLLKKGDARAALGAARSALTAAADNDQKSWAYFHMAKIHYELRSESDTFSSLFKAVNYGRGYGLVRRITEYWESIRHLPFPKD